MEEKIIDCITRREIIELSLFLDTTDIKEIKNLMINILKDDSKFYKEDGTGCFAIICALFKASATDDLKGEKKVLENRELRRGTIIHEMVRWLIEKGSDTTFFDKAISDLVGICINEIAVSTTESPVMIEVFVEITTSIVQAIQCGNSLHGKLFSFLPALLSAFDSCNEVVSFPSGQNSTGHSMSGQDYKNYVLNKLCNTRWHTNNVLSLAGEFRDIPMSNEQLNFVVEKIMSHFEIMDINGVPPLIYQMLLLSRKGQKRLILRGITEFFNRLDDETHDNQDGGREHYNSDDSLSFSQLSHMEGTVIIHICFAITQDQELGNEFMKFIKSAKTSFLKPFSVACLLSIARIHRFEDQALDFLKLSILTAFKDMEKLEKAKWISRSKVDVSKIISSLPLVELFQNIIQKTSFGWDQVTQSLVQLGIILMDLAAPASWKVSDTTRTKKGISITPNDMAKDLGTKILLKMFKIHDMVRAEILDQIQSRVISKSSSVEYFLNLLELIVKETPNFLYNYVTRIKGTLEYLSFLSITTADNLLKAIQPLLYINQSLLDGLMVILRKGLFTKELEGRQIALAGYLRLLKMPATNNREICSMPQMSMSSSNVLPSNNLSTLSFEIIGNLRKCFSQQPQLRLSLYEGLLELMDVRQYANPIIPIIFDILYSHFQKFFELGSSLYATVHIENCIETLNGEPHIVEPLPYLLVCLSKSIIAFKTINEDNEGYSQFNKSQLEESKMKIQTLIDQLIHSDMSEFMIYPNADFRMNSKEGSRNNMCASILLGMYEAAIEHTFFASEPTSESSEIILRLFKRYTALFEVLKEKSANARGRKTVTSITENSILSFKCIAELCKFTLRDTNGTEIYAANSVLRTDSAFVKYLTAVAHNKISQIISSFNPEDEKTFGYCTSLAQVFMNEFIKSNKASMPTCQDDNNKKEKGKSIFAIAIENFALLAQAVSFCWPDKLIEFLALSYPSELANELIPNDLNGWLDLYIREFEHLFIISLNERIPYIKEALGLFQTITLLSSHLTDSINISESNGHLEQLVTWLRTLCETRVIEDTILAKNIINLLIKLEKDMREFETSAEIAHDMLTVLGDINGTTDGVEMNPKNRVVLGQNEVDLQHTDLDCEKIDMTDIEQVMCARLITIINTMICLEQTSLQDSSSEQLIKCLQKTYKVMIALIKYKIAEGGEILKHFIDVIELTGLKLTENLYSLLLAFGSKPEINRIQFSKKRKLKIKSTTQKARIARESKIIPDLIFLLEQYERYLIQLAKKSKVDLTQYIKRATNRDFKIKTDLMDELGDKDKNSKKPAGQSQEEAEEGENEENNEVALRNRQTKRRRS
ncbi:FANCI solenoid 2-domain-containing protein [Glomus cerebriforme]|uniref:FANCI solenoid 2-domain-containing protein n=1 Tax=Glomus cerebriforme TaxID=658196 RepID=A0A397SNN2_9GLOM|nr:FANCI solenoid 2-domain-containing protein [Glomus cerebriforme]